MDTAKVKEYVCLEKRKDSLAAELKQVEQDLTQPPVIRTDLR